MPCLEWTAAETSGVELSERVRAVVGHDVLALREVPGAGGYTPALRRIAELADGSTVFVKAAVDAMTADWISAERAAYEALGKRRFLPAYLGGDDEGLLVLEDLCRGHWPLPWRPGDVDRVFALLDELRATPAPSGIPLLNDARGDLVGLWSSIAENPEPLLRLGVCSASWLREAAPLLAAGAERAELDGESIVHYDVRSDNLCLLEERTVLVDWNVLCRGNSEIDRVFFAQTVTMEGGPAPWELLPGATPDLVAVAAGFFADRAPQPMLTNAPAVRGVQRAQLEVCLAWAARLLDLPPPIS
jgi:hypothetical protein